MRRPRTAVALAAAALLALLTLVLGASKAERAALLALKGAILEDPGQVLASWTEGSNPCGGGGIAADGSPLPAWGGVTCDEEGAVVAVDLASTGGERLSGTLPSALAALPDLLTLNLAGNLLTGTLPALWATGLAALEELYLQGNALSGSLPPSWGGGMAQLRYLSLAGNALSGALPPDWGGLAYAHSLDLSRNALSGPLPAAWSRLALLYELDLSNNALSGPLPTAWSALPALAKLSVAGNSLSGTLPAEWCAGMPKLRLLDVSSNQLFGPLPEQWSAWRSLQVLRLAGNALSGRIPPAWSSMSALTQLRAEGNAALCGEVPARLRPLLQQPGSVNGTLLDQRCRWARDAALLADIRRNLVDPQRALAAWLNSTDPCCPALPWPGVVCDAREGHVNGLSLERQALSGTLPPQLMLLTQLREIRLAGNQLRGGIPDGDWAALADLRWVDLSHNELTSTLPAAWAQLQRLSHLDLSANGLSGTLPQAWADGGIASSLRTLLLGHNQLSGSLPANYSRFKALQVMRLDSNLLTGPLPAEWGAMSQLRELSLRSNFLSGPIPATWAHMADLRFLDLDQNSELCGQVPLLSDQAPGGGFNIAEGSPPGAGDDTRPPYNHDNSAALPRGGGGGAAAPAAAGGGPPSPPSRQVYLRSSMTGLDLPCGSGSSEHGYSVAADASGDGSGGNLASSWQTATIVLVPSCLLVLLAGFTMGFKWRGSKGSSSSSAKAAADAGTYTEQQPPVMDAGTAEPMVTSSSPVRTGSASGAMRGLAAFLSTAATNPDAGKAEVGGSGGSPLPTGSPSVSSQGAAGAHQPSIPSSPSARAGMRRYDASLLDNPANAFLPMSALLMSGRAHSLPVASPPRSQQQVYDSPDKEAAADGVLARSPAARRSSVAAYAAGYKSPLSPQRSARDGSTPRATPSEGPTSPRSPCVLPEEDGIPDQPDYYATATQQQRAPPNTAYSPRTRRSDAPTPSTTGAATLLQQTLLRRLGVAASPGRGITESPGPDAAAPEQEDAAAAAVPASPTF